MKVTNKHNVPETLVSLATRDYYTKGRADYSVTEIISPPRIQRLRRKHNEEMEQDVSDMLWQLLGSALHVVAERGAERSGVVLLHRGVELTVVDDEHEVLAHGLDVGRHGEVAAPHADVRGAVLEHDEGRGVGAQPDDLLAVEIGAAVRRVHLEAGVERGDRVRLYQRRQFLTQSPCFPQLSCEGKGHSFEKP